MQPTFDYAAARAQVETKLNHRLPFYEIESWINRQPLGAQQRDALWLLAWIEKERADDQLPFGARPER